jgi:hypothetical protein
MEARFLYADFRAYFAFIDTAAGGGDYRHHVAPKCEFPELEKDWQNIALLSYEDHKEVHRLLSEAVPEHTGFRLAILYMFAYEKKDYENMVRLNGIAATQSGALARGRAKLGTKGLRAALEKAWAAQTIEDRRIAGSKGAQTQAAIDALKRAHLTHEASGYANCAKGRAAAALDPKKTLIAQMKCGLEAAFSGQLAKAREIIGIEGLRSNMEKGRHTRWHARRGIVNRTCSFCNV